MARPLSENDLMLLGYADAEKLDSPPNTYLYRATAHAGLERAQARFIYLTTKFRTEQLRELVPFITSHPSTYIVIPASEQTRLSKGIQRLDAKPQVFVNEDLIWKKVQSTFQKYLDCLRAGVQPPDPFVTPRALGEPKMDLDHEIIKWLRNGDGQSPPIRVIRAPAGVGKTSLARKLVRQIINESSASHLIPVYVEAEHWAKLRIETVDELWMMINNSLHHFQDDLHIPRPLFEHLLRVGHLTFVFDGFDELCGHRSAMLSPRDVLTELEQLVQGSAARILLTSRTAYWDAEVGSSHHPTIQIVDLSEFVKQQAHSYLDQRFKDNKKLALQARGLLDNVRTANRPPTKGGGRNQPTYHPYVLSLIATAAEGGLKAIAASDSSSPMWSILLSLCEREKRRQSLSTSAAEQLKAFTDVAVTGVLSGISGFSAEDCAIGGFESSDLDRLRDHPLIKVSGSDHLSGKYVFRYDFLTPLLVAQFLTSEILLKADRGGFLSQQAVELMRQEANGKSFVIDHVVELWEDSDVRAIGRVHSNLPPSDQAKSFLFHLARLIIGKRFANADRKQRAHALLQEFDSEDVEGRLQVRNLFVLGSIEKLDLRNVEFHKCTFDGAEFSDCICDERTLFTGCQFLGEFNVVGNDRRSWSAARYSDDCVLRASAKLTWSDLQADVATQGKGQILEAVRIAIAKFWHHGRLKPSIRKAFWQKGPIGTLEINKKILDEMLRQGLVNEITISGVSEGGYAIHMGAVGDIQNFMDNGQASGLVRRVINKLHEES